ncbi:MAG: hypothetical protein PVI09_19270, partial [Anaerolineae bacterium]
MKRKSVFLSLISISALVLALLATACGATEAPTQEPTVAPTEAPPEQPTAEPTEAMPEEPEASVCGTDEEVTITYIGDPAGSHPDA